MSDNQIWSIQNVNPLQSPLKQHPGKTSVAASSIDQVLKLHLLQTDGSPAQLPAAPLTREPTIPTLTLAPNPQPPYHPYHTITMTSPIPYHTLPNPTPYHTIPYHTIPHHTIPSILIGAAYPIKCGSSIHTMEGTSACEQAPSGVPAAPIHF